MPCARAKAASNAASCPVFTFRVATSRIIRPTPLPEGPLEPQRPAPCPKALRRSRGEAPRATFPISCYSDRIQGIAPRPCRDGLRKIRCMPDNLWPQGVFRQLDLAELDDRIDVGVVFDVSLKKFGMG